MAEHVLRPLHPGRAVDLTPPAWAEHGRSGTISVPAGLDVVWVEGTGIVRGELAEWIDASTYVQADLDAQTARLVARDGDDTAVREHVAAWLARSCRSRPASSPGPRSRSSWPVVKVAARWWGGRQASMLTGHR